MDAVERVERQVLTGNGMIEDTTLIRVEIADLKHLLSLARSNGWQDIATPGQVFEMGFEWAMGLRGQTLEDSRAVGRTLFTDTFAPIADLIDAEDFNSFEDADAGIAACKKIIHEALDRLRGSEG